MSVRFNTEIVSAETGDESTENYLPLVTVMRLLRGLKEGDAMVINVVAGPGKEEI